eukprot:m.224907 g.224907  ORF g.224907 m.224907 type:complete len:66 (+) comp15651_c0_seq15:166-363(+)
MRRVTTPVSASQNLGSANLLSAFVATANSRNNDQVSVTCGTPFAPSCLIPSSKDAKYSQKYSQKV